MSYIFLTPEQYNKIYSESSKILINANINERINSLQAENKKLIAEVEWQEERNTGNTLMYQQQIKKLREALEFYAESNNYLLIEDRDKSDIELDSGNFAREALKEIGE